MRGAGRNRNTQHGAMRTAGFEPAAYRRHPAPNPKDTPAPAIGIFPSALACFTDVGHASEGMDAHYLFTYEPEAIGKRALVCPLSRRASLNAESLYPDFNKCIPPYLLTS